MNEIILSYVAAGIILLLLSGVTVWQYVTIARDYKRLNKQQERT